MMARDVRNAHRRVQTFRRKAADTGRVLAWELVP
jgi:hypothetical protein